MNPTPKNLLKNLCIAGLLILPCPAEPVKMFGQTYEVNVPPIMLETAVTWATAKPLVENFLLNRKNQGELKKELNRFAIALAKNYDEKLRQLAKLNNRKPEEIAAMFQSGKTPANLKETQNLHNLLTGINHLSDAIADANPTPTKPPEVPANPETPPQPPAPPPPTSIEWGK